MGVDNSGPTVVFDAKTNEAIEAGKNRITLLQAEELRYNRLLSDLKAGIVTAEASLADKTKQVELLDEDIASLQKEIVEATGLLEEVKAKHKVFTGEIETKTAELTEREAAVAEREAKVAKEESRLATLAKAIDLEQAELDEEVTVIELKKKLIQDLVSKL